MSTIFEAVKSSDNKTAKQLMENFVSKFEHLLDG